MSNSIMLVYKLMEYIKFQTNLSKDYSLENMNNLLKQFCEIHNVTCKQSLIIKYHKGVTKYLSTNDGKPLTLYKIISYYHDNRRVCRQAMGNFCITQY